jgi:hypothetical protein
MKMKNTLVAWIRQAAMRLGFSPVPAVGLQAVGSTEPVRPRVLLIIYNPTVAGEGGRRLHDVLNWNDPDELTGRYIEDVRESSYGYANYEIVERIEVDDMPDKVDGFKYRADDYVQHWRSRSGFHQPDAVDYHRILDTFRLVDRINDNTIEEVWLHGFPFAGFYESIMVGPGAFWCNAPPLPHTDHYRRRFVVMGFSYERGVGEMLENLGHRAESIIRHVYRHTGGDANLWQRFSRYDQTHPGQAEVGIMHFAPNSVRDYDWGNPTYVPSRCHDWRNFPHFQGEVHQVNRQDWGNGDIRQHHLWWFRLLPHVAGAANGISHNWWEYIIDPNKAA